MVMGTYIYHHIHATTMSPHIYHVHMALSMLPCQSSDPMLCWPGAASASKTSSKAWSKESLAGGAPAANRECNVREIPMLSMFLQRLHQHHYFPPIRVSHKGVKEILW